MEDTAETRTGARHVYGPRQVGRLLPAITRPAFRRRSPATAQIVLDWDLIVGPELAAEAIPSGLRAGTLTISCEGPTAMELQHLSAGLLALINAHLGRDVVQRLRFMQDHRPKQAPSPPQLRAENHEAAERAVASMPRGELRDALASLGRAALSTYSPAKR